MKKAMLFFAFLAMCLAWGASAWADVTLPDPIESVFDTSVWADWTVVAADEDTAAGYAGIRAAVIMKRGDRNVLCLLAKHGSEWVITDMTANAVYQGDRLPALSFDGSDVLITRLTVSYPETASGVEEQYHWVTFEDMPWCLSDIALQEPQRDGVIRYTRIAYAKSKLIYQEELVVGGNEHFAPYRNEQFYGRFFRMLRNFDILGYARTMENVPLYLAPPSYLAAGEQQDAFPQAQPAKLSHGKGRTVYLGPGRHYEEAAVTRLRSSTRVEAIAAEGGFAFITFEGADGLPGYGYIAFNALSTREALPEAQFACLAATVSADDYLLDAPDTGNVIRMVSQGETVTYLGTVGSAWSYVEIGTPAARGFIRSDALAVQYDLDVGDLSGAAPNALAARDVRVIDDPYRRPEQTTVATLFTGTPVVFIDNLYGEWAYIEVRLEGDVQEPIRGFVPRDAVVSMDAYALEGNG